MRLLRRNTTVFWYRPFVRSDEKLLNGRHTGTYEPVYGDPIQYRGNISAPSGSVSENLFGQNIQYTHVLLMDDPDADIREDGLVEWKNGEYEIRAVRPSINVLAVALRKRTKDHTDGDVW